MRIAAFNLHSHLPCFTGEETEAWGLKADIPKVTHAERVELGLDPLSAPLLTPPSTPTPTTSTRLGVEPPCVLSSVLSLP